MTDDTRTIFVELKVPKHQRERFIKQKAPGVSHGDHLELLMDLYDATRRKS